MEIPVIWDRLYEVCKTGAEEKDLAAVDAPNEIKGLIRLAVTKDRTKLADISRYALEFSELKDYTPPSVIAFLEKIVTVLERPE